MSSDVVWLEKKQWRHLFSSETICVLHTLNREVEKTDVTQLVTQATRLPSPPSMDQGQQKRDRGLRVPVPPPSLFPSLRFPP